jgi:hypothetical protein
VLRIFWIGFGFRASRFDFEAQRSPLAFFAGK